MWNPGNDNGAAAVPMQAWESLITTNMGFNDGRATLAEHMSSNCVAIKLQNDHG